MNQPYRHTKGIVPIAMTFQAIKHPFENDTEYRCGPTKASVKKNNAPQAMNNDTTKPWKYAAAIAASIHISNDNKNFAWR